jgi:hypothetical protein
MKLLFISLLLVACVSSSNQHTLIMNYNDFGPQVIASDIIGMEWWQWEVHGESRPTSYPIKVVVYRNISLAAVKKQYPINQQKGKDFRYLEYNKASAYLDEKIEENVVDEVTDRLRETRATLIRALGRAH